MISKVVSIPTSTGDPKIPLGFVFVEAYSDGNVVVHDWDGRRFYGELTDETTVVFESGRPDLSLLQMLEDYFPVDASWIRRR